MSYDSNIEALIEDIGARNWMVEGFDVVDPSTNSVIATTKYHSVAKFIADIGEMMSTLLKKNEELRGELNERMKELDYIDEKWSYRLECELDDAINGVRCVYEPLILKLEARIKELEIIQNFDAEKAAQQQDTQGSW